MRYVQRLPIIEAHQIFTVDQAVALTGWDPAIPHVGEDWAIETDIPTPGGIIRGYTGGNAGDYMYLDDGFWNRVPSAEFEALWEPIEDALRTSTLRRSDLRG